LSSLSIRARPKAWQFIRENLDRIHHCPAVHAKAVIGQDLAMLGSANLTITGILSRTEMGILIDDAAMVGELNSWFETLWIQTESPIADEASAFIRWLDDEARRSPTRREKFSLSASGMKIRARLAQLPLSQPSKHEGATIKLEEIAQSLIFEQQVLYKSLGDALESAINALAENEFTFSQIVQSIRRSFPLMTMREIYFALLQHCANHVRSVFSQDTRNRLIWANGRFAQSSKELIHQALVPFDVFLVHLVEHFDFIHPRDMLDEDDLKVLTGIRGLDQAVLVSGLLECGFLEIDDIPGHLPRYRLSEVFEWSGRYKLFVKAMHVWNAKNSSEIRKTETLRLNALTFSKSADEAVEKILEIEDMSLPDYLHAAKKKAEVAEQARKELQAAKRKQRQHEIDKLLAHLLRDVLSGKQMPPNGEMLAALAVELNVNPKWVQKVLRGDPDIPKVLLSNKAVLSINPELDWTHLAGYPLAQDVCKGFLKI